MNWFPYGQTFFGDDNARGIFGVIISASIFKDERWSERIFQSILGNYRTTGKNGFRENALNGSDLNKNGWQHYFNNPAPPANSRDGESCEIRKPQPHFDCYLWALFLLAWKETGYEEFYIKAEVGLRKTMAHCCKEVSEKNGHADWGWTNGITQEYARIILPLAFLHQTGKCPESEEWLNLVIEFINSKMHSSGAIQEWMGNPETGKYPPPSNNDAYGTNEASLFHCNGDAVNDALYTSNFAMLGLHEALMATGSQKIEKLYRKLEGFHCRIQISSKKHRYLDGAWARAFDFKRWEYYGATADDCWGPFSVESGWTNTWIPITMALHEKEISLFDMQIPDNSGIFAATAEKMLNTDSAESWYGINSPNLPMQEWNGLPEGDIGGHSPD